MPSKTSRSHSTATFLLFYVKELAELPTSLPTLIELLTAQGSKKKNKKNLSADHERVLKFKLLDAFGETWSSRGGKENLKKQIEKFKEIVVDCGAKEKLITVYDMNKHEGELDVAILSALLKGQVDYYQSNIKQLELALTWNRSDVAEEKIFNQDVIFPEDELANIMTVALKEDKVDFVRLAIQNGVIAKKFLTKEKLEDLYFDGPKALHFRQLLIYCDIDKISSKNRLATVAKLAHLLIGGAGKDHCMVTKEEDGQNDAETSGQQGSKEEPSFKHPYKELFLWAILMNRQEMAKYFWQQGSEPLPSALAASWIFGRLAHKLPTYESDLIKSCEKNKEEFEQLAIKVLEECHNADPEKAVLLLKKKNMMWGGMTCLEMGADAKDRAFLSTVCCQNTLNEMWQKGIQSHWAMVVLALFFPPLIAALKFKSIQDTDDDRYSNNVFRNVTTNQLTTALALPQFKNLEKRESIGENEIKKKHSQCHDGMEKINTFYSAPITKFAANLVTFTIFVMFYSYMILFDFRATITVTEWIILGWILTMFLEELREMFFAYGTDTLPERLKAWWQFSIFNRIDFIIFIVASVGFVLRWIPGQFQSSKMIYCCNCGLLFVRVFRYYSASSYLGPKLLMMTKMIQELLIFLMVFLVALVAYGITTQTLMYGEREPYALIFRDIFYYGYWQLFGQLFLDEMQGVACNGVNGTLSNGADCPNSNWLVIVFTALYLLIANVLLMNILIAIFNHVFDEIESNAIEFWKYGMYFLVVEFERKPRLAPPFIILEHIYLGMKWLFESCVCRKQAEESESSVMDEVLTAMERECRKQFLQKQKNSENENTQKKIRFIETRVDDVAKMLEEDRILEEQRHFDLEGPSTPLHCSPRHSTHLEPDLKALYSQDAGDKKEILSSQNSVLAVTVIQNTDEDPSERRDKKIQLKDDRPTRSRDSRPQVIIEMASDEDDNQHELQKSETQERNESRGKNKMFQKITDVDNNLNEGNTEEMEKLQQMSWEKRILDADAFDKVPFTEISQVQQSKASTIKSDRNDPRLLSQSLPGIEKRLRDVESLLLTVLNQLAKIEEKSERSLYNIESLLRNAVFYQGVAIGDSSGCDNKGFST